MDPAFSVERVLPASPQEVWQFIQAWIHEPERFDTNIETMVIEEETNTQCVRLVRNRQQGDVRDCWRWTENQEWIRWTLLPSPPEQAQETVVLHIVSDEAEPKATRVQMYSEDPHEEGLLVRTRSAQEWVEWLNRMETFLVQGSNHALPGIDFPA